MIPHVQCTDALEGEIAAFANALDGVRWDARVPTAPDWSVRQLIEHLGGIHRWSGTMVQRLSHERVAGSSLNLEIPSDVSELPVWIRSGGELLVTALRAADPGAAMWAWGADKHARFWSRRQLHETAIHRGDLFSALGREPAFADWVAIDGVEEFLDNLPHAAYFAPNVANLKGDGETIGLRAGEVAWTIRLHPEGFAYERADDAADVTVEGAPADLYVFAWGRKKAADLAVKGDEDLFARWVQNSSI